MIRVGVRFNVQIEPPEYIMQPVGTFVKTFVNIKILLLHCVIKCEYELNDNTWS